MIPTYKGQTLDELSPEMKAFAMALEGLINEHKARGLSAADALNVLANAYANMGRAVDAPAGLLKDLVATCVDHTQQFPPETFYRPKAVR